MRYTGVEDISLADYQITPDAGDARVDIERFLAAVQMLQSAASHEQVEEVARTIRALIEPAFAARHRLVEYERMQAYAYPPIDRRMHASTWERLIFGRR